MQREGDYYTLHSDSIFFAMTLTLEHRQEPSVLVHSFRFHCNLAFRSLHFIFLMRIGEGLQSDFLWKKAAVLNTHLPDPTGE